MDYVKEGDKLEYITEMVPLIEISTGSIVDWKVLRSFRINTPKKKKADPVEPLATHFEEEEKL